MNDFNKEGKRRKKEGKKQDNLWFSLYYDTLRQKTKDNPEFGFK